MTDERALQAIAAKLEAEGFGFWINCDDAAKEALAALAEADLVREADPDPTYWADDIRVWHCGICGGEPCACGQDLMLVVKVPWTDKTLDAETVGRELIQMVNDDRAANSDDEADPVRLAHAQWMPDRVAADPIDGGAT